MNELLSVDKSSSGSTTNDRRGRPRPARVLVLDDSEAMRYLLTVVLSRFGCETHAAADGEAGWEALSVGQYDLLITDNDMPGLTGMELVARLRSAGLLLPVIVISGWWPLGTPEDYPALKLSAVLPKPFTPTELAEVVERTLICPAMSCQPAS